MSIADLRRLTAEAASDAVAGVTDDEGTAEAEATSEPDANSDASSEGTSATGSEGTSESEALDGTDIPDEYFGFKFPPDLSPEQRVEIFNELKKRDDTIGKLLRGKEADVAPVEETAADEPEELTDEAILQALGLDPDNPFEEQTAKAVVPLVRKQIEQESVIAALVEMQELAELDRTWRSTLSSLEREFGTLPQELSHDSVMEFAAENSIASPVDAYWRIVGPGRAAVETLAAERAKKLNEAKRKSATTRPSGSTATDETPVEAKTTKGATREAASRILRELGFDT